MPGNQKFVHNYHLKGSFKLLDSSKCLFGNFEHLEQANYKMSICSRQRKIRLKPAVKYSLTNFFRKPHSNLLKVFDISLEMSSDPKHYFGFTLDQFTELGHTIKTLGSCLALPGTVSIQID